MATFNKTAIMYDITIPSKKTVIPGVPTGGGFRKQQCFSGWAVDPQRRMYPLKGGKGEQLGRTGSNPLGHDQS